MTRCAECNEDLGDSTDEELCQDCCDHSDVDFPCCLICGKDVAEDMMAQAYDRAKDLRKYGH